MPALPITETRVIGLFVQALLLGVHMISFGFCMQALINTKIRGRKTSNSTWAIVVASLFLLVNATFDTSLALYDNLQAFVFYEGPGGPTQELTNVSDWMNITRVLSTALQTIVGDAMLIYRCWVIYDGRWLVVTFSILLWVGCSASAIWWLCLEASVNSRVLLSVKTLRPAEINFCALTVAVNVVTTSLIVWRIRSVDRQSKGRIETLSEDRRHGRQSRLQKIMWILLESGFLYTLNAFITFVTFTIGSNVAYISTDAEIQIIGIAFNLIIIRASRLSERPNGTTMGGHHARSKTLSFRVAVDPGVVSFSDSRTPEMSQYSLSRSDVERVGQC